MYVPTPLDENLVWIDLESTGLNEVTDDILEIAVVVTDKQLNELGFKCIAIHHPDALLDGMTRWCKETHTKSGLIQRCKESTTTLEQAEVEIINFIKYLVNKGKSPMCGNNIGFDKTFLKRHMPNLSQYFHYRVVDVSSFNLLVKRWAPEKLDDFKKTYQHSALIDIRESIDELKYYRKNVMSI